MLDTILKLTQLAVNIFVITKIIKEIKKKKWVSTRGLKPLPTYHFMGGDNMDIAIKVTSIIILALISIWIVKKYIIKK